MSFGIPVRSFVASGWMTAVAHTNTQSQTHTAHTHTHTHTHTYCDWMTAATHTQHNTNQTTQANIAVVWPLQLARKHKLNIQTTHTHTKRGVDCWNSNATHMPIRIHRTAVLVFVLWFCVFYLMQHQPTNASNHSGWMTAADQTHTQSNNQTTQTTKATRWLL